MGSLTPRKLTNSLMEFSAIRDFNLRRLLNQLLEQIVFLSQRRRTTLREAAKRLCLQD